MSDDARPLIDNPYRASHTPIYAGDVNVTDLMARAWDRGFAAGDERLRSDYFDKRLDESWEPSPAASPDERLREAADRLLAAFAAEEDEHGFPFSFELRDAHRALLAATDRDKPGQRPWATDEDYAAEHAEKPKRNHAPWCEGGHGDTPCPATDRDKPKADT